VNADPLEWLVPDALPPERAELRRLVQALRLLHADGARPGARSVEPSWQRARGELEEVARREALRALETLLVAHLAALLPGDSFLPLPAAPLALDEAWRILLARQLFVPPRPGEALASGARALVARGLALGAPAEWARVWRTTLEHAERGLEPRRWEREVTRARAQRTRPRALARLVAGWAASELERGAPARALAVLQAHAPLARLEPALLGLGDGCVTLLGRPAPVGRAAWTPLPRGLHELAQADARFAAAFAGTPSSSALRPAAGCDARRAFGAELVALLEHDGGGRARLVQLEGAAPALESALAHVRAPGQPLLRVWRHGTQAPLAAALGGARTRALAGLELGRSASGAARWLQLEWSHALLPCGARLLEFARAFVPGARPSTRRSARAASGDPRLPLLTRLVRRLRAQGIVGVAFFEPGVPARALLAQGPGLRLGRLAREGEQAARALGLATHELTCGARALLRVHARAAPAQLSAALAPAGMEFLCAQFRALERARGRGDPWLLPAHLAPAAAAGFRGPFWIKGPPGAGRDTLARALLHAAGHAPDEPGRCAAAPALRAQDGGWAWCAGPDERAPAGVLELSLVALAERRAELAALLLHLARAQVPALALTDEALAELWRRDWEGFAVLAEVFAALAAGGPRVALEDVRRVLAARGLRAPARRCPAGADLEQALAATRHRNGQENRARAARWLGVSVGRLRASGK